MTNPDSQHHEQHQDDAAKLTDLPADQCHRYEIATAMDAVITYCRSVVNDHSHRGRWAPTGDNPDTAALITQARETVLSKLRMVLNCADTVLNDVERNSRKQANQPGE